MITLFLLIIPFFFGILAFFIKNRLIQKLLISGVAFIHLTLVVLIWIFFNEKSLISIFDSWFTVDSIGLIFLTIMSILFFGASLYGIEALFLEKAHSSEKDKKFFSHESIFTGSLILFLATMTMVTTTTHLAILWVAIEATTLVTAPLIYFHKTKGSLEATWKYLLICSVGIAIALLGVFFVAVANSKEGDLVLSNLLKNAENLDLKWLKAGFLLLFVGYGTKMGLAPFHTWLPDAHSEAPSKVSALLSGTLLNCAFLGIIRIYEVCVKANLGEYCREIFIVFGILSLFFASIFILGQKDYKRMLAYSSIEHMGILILGLGIGGIAVYASLFNALAHSLTKAGLFLTAGNILFLYNTKSISSISGLIRKNPFVGFLWFFGFLLITGTPPSAIFMAKFMILKELVYSGQYLVLILFLLPLVIIFIGMAKIFLFMIQGEDVNNDGELNNRVGFFRITVPFLFFTLCLIFGLFLPEWLDNMFKNALQFLGG